MDVVYNGGNSGYFDTSIMEFNRFVGEGHFNPTWWIKYVELSRQIFGSKVIRACCGENAMDDKTMYIVRQQANFTSHVEEYVKLVNSNAKKVHNFPIRIFHSTEMVKNTSLLYFTKITDLKRNVKLITVVSHMVFINKATRRPTPLPQQLKHVVNSGHTSVLNNVQPIQDPLSEPPSQTKLFKWSRKISLLDTDYNGHANNSVFFTIPLQCLGIAIESKFSPTLKESIHDYAIDKYCLKFVKECHSGQVITATMWQSCGSSFHFILKVNEQVVSCLTLTFV
ncbi:uncharacterized protein LOC100180199 [Ciona intestinalis]